MPKRKETKKKSSAKRRRKDPQDEKLCLTKGQLINIVDAAENKKGHCKKAKTFIRELKTEALLDRKKELIANISRAQEMGRKAYYKGKQAPAQDSIFLNTFADGRPVGDPDFKLLLKAWSKGWMEEHHKESEKRLKAVGFYSTGKNK